jgi:opine dehydrogenase
MGGRFVLDKKKIAVISSGNGGQTMAAYLAHMGFSVSLYVREEARADMFPADGVFHLRGMVEANPVVRLVSCNMAEVIRDAHLIMVTTPSQYHPVVAREMCGCLEDGQIIVLNPGRTFGSHVFLQTLRQHGYTHGAVVAEAETFVFACRCLRVAEPHIHGIKRHVRVAAHNPQDTAGVTAVMQALFPGIVEPAVSTLQTGFSNIGMIFHPLPILLNITRVEMREKFLFYLQGISPLVANILERMDRERMAVAKAFGVSVQSAYDWLLSHYGAEGDTLYERIQNNPAYAHIYAPVDIDTRYIYEDILTGCVPMHCAGVSAGVETPVIKSSILWASTIYGSDFIQNGRNDRLLDFGQIKADAGPA